MLPNLTKTPQGIWKVQIHEDNIFWVAVLRSKFSVKWVNDLNKVNKTNHLINVKYVWTQNIFHKAFWDNILCFEMPSERLFLEKLYYIYILKVFYHYKEEQRTVLVKYQILTVTIIATKNLGYKWAIAQHCSQQVL